MNISELNYDIAHSYTKCVSDNDIKKVIQPLFTKFDRLLKFYVKFNLFFLILAIVEIITLIVSFRFLAESAWLAFSFGFIFLTFFSYFILRLYFQTQKPIQFKELKEDYEKNCKLMFRYEDGNLDKHVTVANAYCKLANSLHKKESLVFKLPSFLALRAKTLNTHVEKFSTWWFFLDVHQMKELLLAGAVDEHIKVVKCEPTSQAAHAALANAYVMLSGLYASFERLDVQQGEKTVAKTATAIEMEQKFRLTAERAIEEFKIICDYAPDDAWVHKQLAFSYHDLQMPIEEIKEYEIVLKINPDDKDTLYKLGVLYFQQGFNAKGLRLYEELKMYNQKKADELIKFYAVYSPF
jgi:tetratricopeptide (TPR) repeat protein